MSVHLVWGEPWPGVRVCECSGDSEKEGKRFSFHTLEYWPPNLSQKAYNAIT